jgi:putative FmdB family regulatory protein
MPTYDYKCVDCDLVQEEFHRISENPTILCSKCGKQMKKIPVLFEFIFKGGGTRGRTMKDRYGKKKTENMSTPTESAAVKASERAAEAKHEESMKKDPYYQHRD